MSIWKNGKLIAGGSQALPLLSFMWADHILNHPSWLRAGTFSWHTGSSTTGVYKAAYAHLADDFNSIPQANVYRGLKDDVVYCRDTAKDANGEAHPYAFTSFYGETCKTVYCDIERIGSLSNTYDGPTSAATLLWRWGSGNAGQFYYRIPLLETIAGTEIRYFVAGDGHKIVMANQESNVAAIYNATGAAWYYILDTANQRFKLPRTKKPATNFIPDFANQQVVTMPFTAPGDGWFIAHAENVSTVVSVNGVSVAQGNWYSGKWSGNLNCQIIVKKGDVVTGAAGTMRFIPFVKPDYNNKNENKYLYFYVGQFTQTAIENTAGLNTELFNGKAGIDLDNVSAAGKATAVGWSIPDTTAGIDIGGNASYTFQTNGWLMITTNSAGSVQYTSDKYTADQYSPFHYGCLNPAGSAFTGMYPVQSGETITKTYGAGNFKVMFYPSKGVN